MPDYCLHLNNGEPIVLVHYVALIGNLVIVQTTHCRWRCGSLVMQCPLSLLLSMTYHLLFCMTYHCYCLWCLNFKDVREKTDCTDLCVIKLTNQVSPSSGFQVPHWSNNIFQSWQHCLMFTHLIVQLKSAPKDQKNNIIVTNYQGFLLSKLFQVHIYDNSTTFCQFR